MPSCPKRLPQAGRALNRGIELCAVVEQMYSLQQSFLALGDLRLLDRMERIAFNALPGTLDPTQWQHQYLQQANGIHAARPQLDRWAPHPWKSDHGDATGFGVEPNFGCCTANFVQVRAERLFLAIGLALQGVAEDLRSDFVCVCVRLCVCVVLVLVLVLVQGWAKFVSGLVLRSADGGVLLATLAPLSASVGNGSRLDVDTLYPFGDSAAIVLHNADVGSSVPLRVRIPGWARNATVSLDGAPPQPAAAGTLYSTLCGPNSSTALVLQLNPEIRVERDWGMPGAHGPPPPPVPAPQPPPPAACKATLTKQIGHTACTEGATFGCYAGVSAAPTMWADKGCNAEFTCNGVDVLCRSNNYHRSNCSCLPPPPAPPPPPATVRPRPTLPLTFRVSACAARTLNATGQSQVALLSLG